MRPRLYVAGLVGTLAAGFALAQPPKPAPKAEPTTGGFTDQFVRSADGVKIAWRLYKATDSKAGSVVIMIPAPGQSAIETNRAWHDEAKRLAGKGFHVATFDHRGVGQSTDIVPNEFYVNAINVALVPAGGNPAAKTSINSQKDFKSGYYPMLVQDVAAVRSALDQLNDTGEVNTSTVYLYGSGDGASLGLFFLGTEWYRERQKPNLPIPIQIVTPRRGLFTGSEPAGQDYGGAVWLSASRNPALNSNALKAIALSPRAINLRTETPMLFVAGEKDTKGMREARSIAQDTLSAKLTPFDGKGKVAPRAGRLPQADVKLATIKKADAASASGLALLGNNTGAEDVILSFLEESESERKGRTRQVRLWDRPLIIDVRGFGVMR